MAENKDQLSHCETCGAPLPVLRRKGVFRKGMVFMIIAILIIGSGGAVYFASNILNVPARITEPISVGVEEIQGKLKGEKQRGPADNGGAEIGKEMAGRDDQKERSDPSAGKVSEESKGAAEGASGWVILTDPWGRQVNKFRAGMTGNGWLALPARACLGGKSWHFYSDSGRDAEISGGLWIHGDRVGLWQITINGGTLDGPELDSWDNRRPVSWTSLESKSNYHSIMLPMGRTEGFFISTPLPASINEAGIFMQDSKIVGWSFGHWLEKGYMWPGGKGALLTARTLVRYFYTITFANGREEKFAMASAMDKGSAGLDQLASFIEGFRLQPKLARRDTPEYLLPEEIIAQVRALISRAIHQGEGNGVVDIMNSQTLKDIGDIRVLMDIVPAIAENRGFEAALGEIEDSGRYIVQRDEVDGAKLSALHLQLYKEWLQSLISAGAVEKGWQTYKAARVYYPDDPALHLLGVELALLNGNWQEAEQLLYMKTYPADFQDRYQLLALRIAEAKGQEGKIVISFPRGSSRIPVTATINGSLYQDFMVDTGASAVTIPSATADSLGLEIVQGYHGGQRMLSTASGVVNVSEVIIDRIEIDGWVEYDITAYILDIPDRPGLGLLGLNYLSRFQMDLRTEEGTLLLTPR